MISIALAIAALLSGACQCGGPIWLHAVRQPAFAGSWYPRDAKALDAVLTEALEDAPEPADREVVAMLAPHAATYYSASVSAAAFRAAAGTPYARIVLLSDAESRFRGIALPNVQAFGSPLGSVPVDREAVEQLARLPDFRIRLSAFDDTFEIENQIPWIRKVFPAAKIVPVVIGYLPPSRREPAAAALRTVLGERSLLVVSSVLSHAIPASKLFASPWNGADIPAMVERSRRFDHQTLSLVIDRHLNELREHLDPPGAACSPTSIEVFAAAVPDGTEGEVVGYDTSATYEESQQMTIDGIVGYGALVFRKR